MPITPKANLLRALYHAEPDHVPWAGEGALRLVDHVGRKPPRSGADEWGVTWAPLPTSYQVGAGEPAESYPVAHPASTAAEALALPFPDPAAPGLFAGLLDGIDRSEDARRGPARRRAVRSIRAVVGDARRHDRAAEGTATSAPASLTASPSIMSASRGGYLAAGVEAGWLADDYAGDGGPLISPALWRKLVLPAIARIIAVYREAGAPVFFHTCGRAEAFVPDLLEAGVTVFNLQSDVCDLAGLKAQFGRRIAFYGGVPSDLMLRGSARSGARGRAARDAVAGQRGRPDPGARSAARLPARERGGAGRDGAARGRVSVTWNVTS